MMSDPYAYTQQPLHRKPMPSHLQPSYGDAPYTHTRTPSSSSTAHSHPVPSINYPPQQNPPQQYQQQAPQNPYTSRRTPSTNTFSTTASSGAQAQQQRPYSTIITAHPQQPPSAYAPSPSVYQRDTDLRRSTSSRSASSTTATSYVQLLRKQKATVWCDRSQTLDARLVASQKAQKIRAQAEMLSDRGSRAGTMVGGPPAPGKGMRVTAKIRHHGKTGLGAYGAQESGGSGGQWGVGVGGVPMRLSASEVDGEQSDEEDSAGQKIHKRSGSGRSSLRRHSYRQSSVPVLATGSARESGRWSRDGTPPTTGSGSGSASGRTSLAELAEAGETPQPSLAPSSSYFAASGSTGASHPVPDRKNSSGSGSSAERGDKVQELDAARVASNTLLQGGVEGARKHPGMARQQSTRDPLELRRRGSVDERTATMKLGSGMGRLYIANPDSGDSD